MSNDRLANPVSGTISFGRVPEQRFRQLVFPTGHIYVPIGKHIGPNRGFGARHIWAEHQKEMSALSLETEDLVPAYVARIVCVGTPLYFGDDHFTKTRLMAVRGASGTAILELREGRDETFWSIVTAFSANKKHSVRIGTVLDWAVSAVAASP